MARRIEVEILGNSADLERAFGRASRSANGFNRQISQASRGAISASLGFKGLARTLAFTSGAFLGGAGVIAVMKSSVAAASNLAEQTSKTNVVFGDSADIVERWSKTTVTAMGLAEDQALATASSFGALLAPLGIVGREAAEQSQRLTQLGADLASFYNTDVQSALDAIRSGLVGESEPLRKYGVLLSETRVQAEALNETHKKSVRDLTAQEKVLARQELIFKDTAQAQGDFARTSDGLANQQRILTANVRQLQILLGQALTPAILDAVRATNAWLEKSENQARILKTIDTGARAAADGFNLLAGAIRAVNDALDFVDRRQSDLGRFGFLLSGPTEAFHMWREDMEDFLKLFGLATTEATKLKTRVNQIGVAVSAIADAATRMEAAFRNATPAASAFADAASRAAQAAANPSRVIGPLLGGLPGGTVQLPSRAVTVGERLGIAIAGDPENVSLIRQALARQEARLAFATKMLDERRGNTAKFVAAARDASGQISSLNAQLVGIAAADARAAQEAADKIREAEEKRRQAVIDAIGEGARGSAQIQNAIDRARAALPRIPGRLSGTGRLTAEQRTAQQFAALGLDASGGELAPTRKALIKEVNRIDTAIEGTFLDTKENRSVIAGIRKALKLGLAGMSNDVRQTVDRLLDDLSGKLGDRGPLTRAAQASSRQISAQLTAGLGLRGDALKQLRHNIITANLVTANPQTAVGAGGKLHIESRVHVGIDGREVALATVTHQTKAKRRSVTQTSGRNAGNPNRFG